MLSIGNLEIVGAQNTDVPSLNSGSAFIFVRSGTTWTREAKIQPEDPEAGDRFGFAVSISGDYALATSYFDDDQGLESGSAYIFHRVGTNWTQQDKLLASDGAPSDLFGHAGKLHNDTALIGARSANTGKGAAYLFTRSGTTWNEQLKIVASDGQGSDYFGDALAVNGNYISIGAYQDDDRGNLAGSMYTFKINCSFCSDPYCDSCPGDVCSVCNSGYYPVAGAGSTCCRIMNCATCASDQQSCDVCDGGLTQDDNGECCDIISNCATCDPTNTSWCLSCDPGDTKVSGRCYSDTLEDTAEETIADITSDTAEETITDTTSDTAEETIADTAEETTADTMTSVLEETTAETISDTEVPAADTIGDTSRDVDTTNIVVVDTISDTSLTIADTEDVGGPDDTASSGLGSPVLYYILGGVGVGVVGLILCFVVIVICVVVVTCSVAKKMRDKDKNLEVDVELKVEDGKSKKGGKSDAQLL